MSTKSDKAPKTAPMDNCLRLQEFKDFLAKNVGENTSVAGNNAITRNANETYPISPKEVKPELINFLWNQLNTKKCPFNFLLGVMRKLINEIEDLKENEFATSLKCKAEDIDNLQYDLSKLQKFLANSLEKFLTKLNDNAEASNLRTYADENSLCDDTHCSCKVDDDDSYSKFKRKKYVVSAIKNKPRKMEDRNVCLERFSELYDLKPGLSFYGVFDGHSGPLAASYATSQLPYLLANYLKENTPKTPDEYREAFENVFLQTDKQFTQKNISSGTTAVCALIDESLPDKAHLYVAWVGDSRALLVGAEASLQLVKSHKPDSTEERQRIEEAGGSVMFVQGQWRVNGFLNVARSIGDYAVGSLVIAEPDFVDVPLSKAHDFLVIGTDGLWDHVKEAAIVSTIYEALENEEQQLADIPKKLIEMAKEGDSQDNITAVVVFLKDTFEIVNGRRKEKAETH